MSTVDSSVGGKTGVNHPAGKNMIGAFYQPRCGAPVAPQHDFSPADCCEDVIYVENCCSYAMRIVSSCTQLYSKCSAAPCACQQHIRVNCPVLLLQSQHQLLVRTCAAVLIDVDTLNTLPDRELASGISEIIKYGLIRDPDLFVWLEANMERLLQRDPEARRFRVLLGFFACQRSQSVPDHVQRPACVAASVCNNLFMFLKQLLACIVQKCAALALARLHGDIEAPCLHPIFEHAGAHVRDRALVREQGAGGGRGRARGRRARHAQPGPHLRPRHGDLAGLWCPPALCPCAPCCARMWSRSVGAGERLMGWILCCNHQANAACPPVICCRTGQT